MLRAAEPDALSTESASDGRVVRCVSIRAHPHAADVVAPLHEHDEVVIELALRDRHFTEHDLARASVDADDVALAHTHDATRDFDREQVPQAVDLELATAGYAAASHASGDHRRV